MVVAKTYSGWTAGSLMMPGCAHFKGAFFTAPTGGNAVSLVAEASESAKVIDRLRRR